MMLFLAALLFLFASLLSVLPFLLLFYVLDLVRLCYSVSVDRVSLHWTARWPKFSVPLLHLFACWSLFVLADDAAVAVDAAAAAAAAAEMLSCHA